MSLFTIFRDWFYSLSIFKPKALIPLLVNSFQRMVYSIKQTVTLFWWMFIIDLFLSVLLQKHLIANITKMAFPHAGITTLTAMIIAIFLLIINATFLLFVRSRSDQLSTIDYVKMYLLRFIQIRLVFVVLTMLLSAIIIGIGISTIPTISSWIIFLTQYWMLLTIFFWLDSPGYLRNVFTSLEGATNLLIYNIPFFVSIIFIIKISYWLLNLIFIQFVVINQHSSLVQTVTQLLASQPAWLATIIITISKYLGMFAEFFLISLIYSYYKQKRSKIYANSIFE